VALVIGNSAYKQGPLKNPVNDARLMSKKLEALGFKVSKIENLTRNQIGKTISGFASMVKPGDEIVIFYAGHGVQIKGVNYLPAVDAEINTEEDVALSSINLNSLIERLDETKAALKIVFLDACRNNPFQRSMRSDIRGLARVSSMPVGTILHFATRPGSVASDGDESNGLYTTQLLKYIDSPNMPIETMLKRVASGVVEKSKGNQEPWTEGIILGDFYFKSTKSLAKDSSNEMTASAAKKDQIVESNSNEDTKVALSGSAISEKQDNKSGEVIQNREVGRAPNAQEVLESQNMARQSSDFANKGSWLDTIRTASISITLNVNNTEARLNRCQAFIARNDYQDAREDCEYVLKSDSRNNVALNNLGVLDQREGRTVLALDKYKQACLGGSTLACNNFKAMKGYAPNDAVGFQKKMNELAFLAFQKGNSAEAIQITSEVLSLYPQNLDALVTRSGARQRLGQFKEGLADAELAVLVGPDSGFPFNNRGLIQESLGSLKKAKLDYEIGCELKAQIACENLKRIGGK
jgi:tetratricopeptide (TPR) repeat protein